MAKKTCYKRSSRNSMGIYYTCIYRLLREAYKDEDNYKFITISESDIPIKTFDEFIMMLRKIINQ